MTNEKHFLKGDRALWLHVMRASDEGFCTFQVEEVVIKSWGKHQGTAISATTGKNTLRRFYTENLNENPSHILPNRTVFRTLAEIEAFAAIYGEAWAARDIAGSLDCEESNFNHLLPQYREAAAARIAKLKALVPHYKITKI